MHVGAKLLSHGTTSRWGVLGLMAEGAALGDVYEVVLMVFL